MPLQTLGGFCCPRLSFFLLGSFLRKRRRGVFGETVHDHLQALAASGGNLVQFAYRSLLPWVFGEVVEGTSVIHDMIPVADHPETSDLRIYPAALFVRIFAPAQAGAKDLPSSVRLSGGAIPAKSRKVGYKSVKSIRSRDTTSPLLRKGARTMKGTWAPSPLPLLCPSDKLRH